MTRNLILFAGLLCLLQARSAAQTPTNSALDPKVVRLLESPYDQERQAGIKWLKKAAKKTGEADFLDPWLTFRGNPLVRFGAAQAAVETCHAKFGLAKIRKVLEAESLQSRKQQLGVAILDCANRSWNGREDFFAPDEHSELLSLAAVEFLRGKLRSMASAGIHATEFLTIASFASLGPYAAPALARIARNPEEDIMCRSYALVALSRVDARDFWLKEDGSFSPTIKAILDDAPESLKVNTLFAFSYTGLQETLCVEELRQFVVRDAYSAETIQGALYFMYTRPPHIIARETKAMEEICREYLDSSYAQKVRFHAALLLPKLEVKKFAKQVVEMIRDAPDFASYWALAALLSQEELLSDQTRTEELPKLFSWIIESEDCAPQLQALVVHHLLKQEKDVPGGLTSEAVAKLVRANVDQIFAFSEDPSYLSVRSGLDILAYLKDPEIGAPLRRALQHKSEAVRMAAGMAAGASGREEFIPDLLELLGDPHEFAAFGAAWGLKTLGHKSAQLWFATYLLHGNACLAPSCLQALREAKEKQLLPSLPKSPNEWRARGRLWLKELAQTSNPEKK